MRFRVLGPLEVEGSQGRRAVQGERQRAVLGTLLAAGGTTVPADVLVELLWGDALPANPGAALHSQVSRLRRALADALGSGSELLTRPPGYVLVTGPDDVDAARFARLVDGARGAEPEAAVGALGEALDLWRGPAYGDLADLPPVQVEAIRLDEMRLAAVEARAAALLASGRPAALVPELEAFVAAHPLREAARETLMRALYATGRHTEALRHYRDHRTHLADELGLEPSVALQRLELEILDHVVEVAPGAPGTGAPGTGASATDGGTPRRAPAALDRLAVRYVREPRGRPIACATIGSGPHLVVAPAWVTSLDVIAAGRDPRSTLLEHLAHHATVTLYDRLGCGLSANAVDDYSLAASAAELEAVLTQVGGGAVLGVSQAGPMAVAVAARRPDLVTGLILLGTFADAPGVFRNPDLTRATVDLVRAHWGLAARMLADLYRPGASADAAHHLGRVLRDCAPPEVAAGYLEEMYRTDVTALLPEVRVPALVMHYRDDAVIPFEGGRQLAAGIPGARFVPLEGRYHLPDAADLPRIVTAARAFLGDLPPP